MNFDYFYGQQAEQFTFYRIPKVLFTNERFSTLSTDAKVLYGLLLDRMSLSSRNEWKDEQDRVFIIFTIESIQEALGCGNKKAGQLLGELEDKVGLITRKRQGLGKPSLIYVHNFASAVDKSVEGHFLKCQNDISGSVERTSLEVSKGHGNNTNINNTEFSNTDPFLSSEESGTEGERKWTRSDYYDFFYDRLEIDCLKRRNPYDDTMLDEILELVVDTYCSNRQMIRIAGDDKPIDVVKSRMMKLEADHLELVLRGMKENTTKVRNIRQYLLAAVYNAPLTISNYWSSLVQHDMANGLI